MYISQANTVYVANTRILCCKYTNSMLQIHTFYIGCKYTRAMLQIHKQTCTEVRCYWCGARRGFSSPRNRDSACFKDATQRFLLLQHTKSVQQVWSCCCCKDQGLLSSFFFIYCNCIFMVFKVNKSNFIFVRHVTLASSDEAG